MSIKDLHEYNAKYYKLNKDFILNKRRSRYQKDYDYRNSAKKRAINQHEKLRKSTPYKDRMSVEDDNGNSYYTIGKLSKIINRSIYTIRSYNRPRVHHKTRKVISEQIIPDVVYVDSRGWKLYSNYQVNLLLNVFKKFDAGEYKSLSEVAEILKREWK